MATTSAKTVATPTTAKTAKTARTTATRASQAISSSKNSGEDATKTNKPTTQTTSFSDEKDPFQNNNSFETKKPETKKIKANYFFTVGYHLVLWIILAIIGFPFFYYFSTPNNTGHPSFYGYGSLIGHYPKLNMLVPENVYGEKDRLIHISFKRHEQISFKHFLDFYANNEDVKVYFNSSTRGMDCLNNDTNSIPGNATKSPYFCDALIENKDEYGVCRDLFTKGNEYGFHNGTPCFMLKFNKILNYIPYIESLENCATIPGCCNQARVKIDCNSTNVDVFPKSGVPVCQWPYKGQENYHSPMAMLYVNNMPNITTYIKCHAVLEDGQEYINKKEFYENGPHTLRFILDP